MITILGTTSNDSDVATKLYVDALNAFTTNLEPSTTNTYDVGTSLNLYRNIYASGTLNAGNILSSGTINTSSNVMHINVFQKIRVL